jgi:putative hydrolase of the HAD superfamily
MVAYIRAELGVDVDEATRLRQEYWQRYGATLLGMMRHHGTDPHHFLWHTHRFPDLKRMLVFERGLRAMLRKLPGRKIVFSNAPLHYSEAVLEAVGIRHCFNTLYSVERLRFQPKPAAGGFRYLLRRERLQAAACIMVEDSLANLQTAKRLGMRTVWISRSTRQPSWIDQRLVSVRELLRTLGRFPASEYLSRPATAAVKSRHRS